MELVPADRAGDDSSTETLGPVLVTITDAARMLAISRSKAYELVAARQLEVVHIGRLIRVPVAAIHQLVATLRDEKPSTGEWLRR